jgi:hypothetical protein
VAAVQAGDIDAVTVRRLIESRATSDHAASQSDPHLLLLLLKDLLLELADKYTEVYTGHSYASMSDEGIKSCKVTDYPTGDDIMEVLLRLKAKSGEEMEVGLRRKLLFFAKHASFRRRKILRNRQFYASARKFLRKFLRVLAFLIKTGNFCFFL